jgi:hypothetical protein
MSINGLNPLSYVGVDSPNPAAQIITMNQDPTVNDSLNFNIGDIWINRNTNVPNTESVFMLTSLSAGQATWTEIGTQGNVLNVLSGTNITVNTVNGDATVNLNPSVTLTGSLNAGTTVTAGTGIQTTTGNIIAQSGNLAAINTQNNATQAVLSLAKNRAGAAVQTGDVLAGIAGIGFDGTANQVSASILVTAVGTIAAGRVPSTMTFSTTPDAVSAALPRVIIEEDGTVTITGNGSASPSLDVTGIIEATGSINATLFSTGAAVSATGDIGGIGGTTTFTNGNVANVPGGGTLSINSQSANPGAQAGFIKIYVGATTAYIPYFTNIAP